MQIGLSPNRNLVTIVCLLTAAVSARADKNNKFELNLSRYRGNSIAYFDRGITEMDKGNLAGARQAFDSAIGDDDQLWPAYLMRAQVFQQLRKYDQALQDCNAAARLKPQFTRTFIIRAQVYWELHQCAKGLADLDRVIAIHSTPESVAFALSIRARLHANCENSPAHDPKKALEDATRACQLDGWHMADYIESLAFAYAANGDFDSAIRYEKKAIDSGRLLPEKLKDAEQRLDYLQKRQSH
ncbi:MAG TPA: tetratricopeptide repeat protein [Chthoniobacterales bacterium]|jgi:tetratricopeptide (TPR) repeat protein